MNSNNSSVNEIILCFNGEPTSPNSSITSTCHGYDAFVCTEHDAINTMMKSLSMWNGHTKLYTRHGNVYRYYELDCRLKEFFQSDIFKRICRPYGTKIAVYENSEEIYNAFYKDAKLSH